VREDCEIYRRLLIVLLLLVLFGASSCRKQSVSVSTVQSGSQSMAQQTLARVETEQERSCQGFVQGFYDWYFDRLNLQNKVQSNNSTLDDVIRLKPEFLSARLQQMLTEDRDAASKNRDEIVGLDFDPYINAQDWDGKYWVQSVVVKGNGCKAFVWGTDSGKKREIVDPELESVQGKWVFVNFHYPGQSDPRSENLIDLLNGLREDRKHPHRDGAP
jgi:Protein of unknown function (DUF3828)